MLLINNKHGSAEGKEWLNFEANSPFAQQTQ